jgi:serine/threonine protein kinase
MGTAMAKKCPKCQFENHDTAKFCSECATPIECSQDVSVTRTLQTPAKGFKKDTLVAKKYKIIEKLGEGGMGVVYKAKDTRLDRTVALKFLPPELTSDEESKKRFIQEAKAAAALNHPYICTVYEIDEAEDQTFISMEYIEGHSLKDKLKDGPLDVDEAKNIALQVAEGLNEAHEKGIVHRDIKPANIMLTKKGQAKIADFGLAKLSWGADLTKPATIMGTVAYMSPEQAKGEEVDHRTDIWSLGAMLYEMLSGERPFQKTQEQALIFTILNDKSTPLSLLRSDIPSHIEQVIDKALAKKAGERYQNVQELIQDLKPSRATHKTEKSIIVLPFENLSPDPDQEYFCDGMTEEIISDLSKVQALKVISRSSAMTFKGTKKKIREIAKDVNVQYALEGSVRKAGNNLRITAQLIEATNDVHLWAEKYSGTLDDVFDIQEKVSSSIVEQMKIKLSFQDVSKAKDISLENAKAYDCYLRARYEIMKVSPDSLDRARRFLQRSLDIIGENAILYAMLGQAYYWYHDCQYKIDLDPLQEAEKYAKKANLLDPNLAPIHFLLGLIERGKGNLKAAVKHIKQAVELDPTDPNILSLFIWTTSVYVGKVMEIHPYSKYLLDIDPVTPLNYLTVSGLYMAEGNWDIAAEYVIKCVEMDPGFRWGYFWLIHIYARSQNRKEFYKVGDILLEENSEDIIAQWVRFSRNVYENDRENALMTLTEELRNVSWQDPEGVWLVACCFAAIGERDQALKWLERAVERGWINYPLLNEYDPFLENIRGEPRFKKLMERIKKEWENFEI